MPARAAAVVLQFPTPAPVAAPTRRPSTVPYIGTAAARAELARTDLARAQAVSPDAPAADLVQLIEALRGSLHDVLQMTMAPRDEWAVLDRAEHADLATLQSASLVRLMSELSADLGRRIA